ncbi:MAG: Glu-tRNA(Gln) amidotransferase subunit GatD [Candidatus Woesearchaeota archaeon]|jgi:glutamyl-tRNA(Gln) amidotransferase subunit D
MPNPGDKVRITTKDSTEEGIMMSSPDEEILLIKLSTGYNIGFSKEDITELIILEEKKETLPLEPKKVETKHGLKTITILHCGGTIASKVDYETGAVKPTFSPEELLELFPELGEIANIKSRLVANMLSENMRFAHYNLIAKEVEKTLKEGSDGIIVTHGTDTLHYTAAALTFALEGLQHPVLLVGSQRSSDRGSSDAFMNLKCATQFLIHSDFKGVGVCMHAHPDDDQCVILPGVKCRKMHSSRRDAFKAINAEPLALVDDQGKIEWKDKDYFRFETGSLNLALFKPDLKVGIMKSHPQMFAEEFKPYHNYDGLVLEGTGLGHFPILRYDNLTKEHESILEEIQKLAKQIPVVMTVQTIFGVVNMDIYAPGRTQIEAGVLGTQLDMPPETAFIKLAWLLSNYDQKETREMISQNLRGEISLIRKVEKEWAN